MDADEVKAQLRAARDLMTIFRGVDYNLATNRAALLQDLEAAQARLGSVIAALKEGA